MPSLDIIECRRPSDSRLITVSGTGTGEMILGDRVIPLVAPPQLRSGAATCRLFENVGYGVKKQLWFRKPAGLDAALHSDEMLIGELPSLTRWKGWIAFPHTDATLPCIHDLASCGKTVSLVHGEEFPGLTATWESESQGVAITNVPPVSAKIYGRFPKTQTRLISYTISHPDYQCGQTNFTQTLRLYKALVNQIGSTIPDNPEKENDNE